MQRIVLAALAALLVSGVALAQFAAPGANYVTSLVGSFGVDLITGGPTTAVLPLNGGTFTCVSATTISVANTNLHTGSLIEYSMRTLGGTPGAKLIQTVTPGTGFTLSCASGDTGTYNYLILG